MTQKLLAVLSCLALAAGAAACGGDDDESDAGTTGATGATGAADAQSKAEYLAEADQICESVSRQVDTGNAADSEAAIEQGIEDLAALTPPAGDEEQIEQILDAARQGLEDLQEGTGQGDPFAEFSRLAQEYGFAGGCTRADEAG